MLFQQRLTVNDAPAWAAIQNLQYLAKVTQKVEADYLRTQRRLVPCIKVTTEGILFRAPHQVLIQDIHKYAKEGTY